MAEKALKGMKVLEYCNMISGPYCTKIMADLGAEVIKIESPGIGDDTRRRPPFPGDINHPEKSGLFLYLNSNKFGITLDPLKPNGKILFNKLINKVDVLVTDRPPGKMELAGLGYEDLKTLNPGLIMTSITPFGLSGPFKDFKAYQLNLSQISSQGYILPIPVYDSERSPVMIGGNHTDYDPGLLTVVAILAAYFWKGITGKGQFIELSKQEALMSMQRIDAVTFPNDGVDMTRISRNTRAINGIVPCKDGHVVIVMPEEHQWQAFLEMMGNPEWSRQDWCQDAANRVNHADEINGYIEDWAKERTQEEIFRKAQALGCPVAPLQSAEDIVNSEQLNSREFLQYIDHPELGTMKYPTMPYEFSKSPWEMERLAPRLGEHNEAIFCGRLGYETEDLERLKKEGII